MTPKMMGRKLVPPIVWLKSPNMSSKSFSLVGSKGLRFVSVVRRTSDKNEKAATKQWKQVITLLKATYPEATKTLHLKATSGGIKISGIVGQKDAEDLLKALEH